jgi:inositol-phosphate phosphatase / L-galactose 1-phosphate phosphatase / histidinol-phosphatase
MDEEEALEFAQHLADVSQAIALRYFRTSLDIGWKEDGDARDDCRLQDRKHTAPCNT